MKTIELPKNISSRVSVYDREILGDIMIKVDFAIKKKVDEVIPDNFIATIYGRKEKPSRYNWHFKSFYSIGYFSCECDGAWLSVSNHAILPTDYSDVYSLLGDLDALKKLLIKLSRKEFTKSDVDAYNGIHRTVGKPKAKAISKPVKKTKVDDRQLDMFDAV